MQATGKSKFFSPVCLRFKRTRWASQTCMLTRGVQIRSESGPIGFVRISEQKYTYRIALIKLFRSRIGSDFDIRNKMN
jgi:hypothetical protein